MHALGKNNNNGDSGHPPAFLAARIFAELAGHGERKQPHEPPAHGADLYDGAAGLALFFAAYYRATRDAEARTLALAALAPVRGTIESVAAAPGSLAAGTTIGGFVGLGSLLYALAAAADWLNAPELMDSASFLAGTITTELIQADPFLDVMKGCAGTLLALLSFTQVARTLGLSWQAALDLATECGRHLLRSRVSNGKGARAWRGVQEFPLAGFAYGAAGISYALARLYEQTKEEQFRDAALEGFAFERTLYSPDQQSWRDPRSNRTAEHGSWCQGAPGIALGRLGAIGCMDEPALRHDLEEALSITRALPEASNDQLCCGNFGRIDVLLTAGTVLERLHLADHALDSSRRIVERSLPGDLRLLAPLHQNSDQHRHDHRPFFFPGLAGVGYTLLRLRYPELLPSVLLLQV
ncbi:MAG TPA: lanthionine synthetase LanC family protein [Candidatus Angelobacter sp.]